MKAYIAFLFHHRHYKEVMNKYKTAVTEHKAAVKVCSQHYTLPQNDSFENKEKIASILAEIKDVSLWISLYESTRFSKVESLRWFFMEAGLQDIPKMNYQNYKLVYENIKDINRYHDYINTYKDLIANHKEAVDRLLGVSKLSHTYEEIKRVAFAEGYIKRISSILSVAHECEERYKQAWKIFSRGRSLMRISLESLENISEYQFKTKEQFLSLYSKYQELIKLIIGQKHISIESFSKETIKRERQLITLLSVRNEISVESLKIDVSLNNLDKLKRAILDSNLYGKKCRFTDDFSISDFYSLRKKYDINKIAFDDAVRKKCDNNDAIRAYNKSRSGNDVVYIEDYLMSMTEGSDLYVYIEKYNEEKTQRNECKRIQSSFRKGFEALYGSKNLDTCDFTDITSILLNKQQIEIKNVELEEQDMRRRESERQRLKEESRRRILRNLKSCVANWIQPSRSTVSCFSLYYYYPTTCSWDASEDEWEIRNLVWDFKANPNRPQSITEIINRHQRSTNRVVPDIKRVLRRYFGSDVSQLTLVCIPSSKRIVTERRYKNFSTRLCNETGMANGYSYVYVVEEGEAAHLGGGVQARFSIDSSFFKERYVILFDDVITSGKSMERFKRLLESAGASVIAGLSIGKTKHERQGSNPIDFI